MTRTFHSIRILHSINNMETLPVEILTKIFSYLVVQDLLLASEVCDTFNSIINTKRFIEKIRANITNSEDFINSSRRYINLKLQHGKEQHLVKCNKLLSSNHSGISSEAKSLKIDNLEFINCIAMDYFLNHFCDVSEIHFEGIYCKAKKSPKFKNNPFPNLRILKFFYNTNSLLQVFSQVKSQLEVFKICLIPHDNEEVKFQNFQFVINILQNNRHTLRKLNFYDVNFDDSFLEKVATIDFSSIMKFSMSFNSYLSPQTQGFEKLIKQNAKNLEKLKIRTFDHIKQDHLKVLTDHAVNIRSLSLIICSTCDYERFSDFRNLGKLEALKIQPSNNCNIASLSYKTFIEDKILNFCNSNLKNVTFEAYSLSDDVVEKIVLSLPNLVELRLSCTSDDNIGHANLLKDKLKSLKKLIINEISFM